MINKHYRVLSTRPSPQGRALSQRLTQAGYFSLHQPMFDYQANADLTEYQKQLTVPVDIVIFVSVAAVNFAHQAMPLSQWKASVWLAVGNATRNQLNALGVDKVVTPKLQTSEGLLALDCLKDVSNSRIIIVRGDGGRELIAETLLNKGADVQYIESYRRHWLNFSTSPALEWQKLDINCILITSNDLLKSVVQLIEKHPHPKENKYWQNTCLWIVASVRIEQHAKTLGLNNVICAGGASDDAIMATLQHMELANDRKENTCSR